MIDWRAEFKKKARVETMGLEPQAALDTLLFLKALDESQLYDETIAELEDMISKQEIEKMLRD